MLASIRQCGRLAVGCAAISAAVVADTAPATSRDGRYGSTLDHSIHILARIPSLCALRDMSRVIKLFVVEHDGVHGEVESMLVGTGSFRIECNVPYAVDVHRRTWRTAVRRARVVPLAATGADYDVAVDMPGSSGPLHSYCGQADLGAGADCTPTAGSDNRALPRASGRLTILARDVGAPPAAAAAGSGDAGADYAIPAGMRTPAGLPAAPVRSAPVEHLTLTLTARL